MNHFIPCLSIAGSDPSCGAGIQADLKTFSALGVYGLTVPTAITIQNTRGVQTVHALDATLVKAQLKALFEDIPIHAVKIGMTVNTAIIQVIVDILYHYRPPFVVLDPIIASTSGHRLIEEESIDYLKKHLFPLCSLITPNLPETQLLTSTTSTTSFQEVLDAGTLLLETGCQHVLIKGGHHAGTKDSTDILLSAKGHQVFTAPRIESSNTHGTGCTLSSAIAAYVGLGFSLPDAISQAKTYLTEALLSAKDLILGQGEGPLNHFFAPQPQIIK